MFFPNCQEFLEDLSEQFKTQSAAKLLMIGRSDWIYWFMVCLAQSITPAIVTIVDWSDECVHR